GGVVPGPAGNDFRPTLTLQLWSAAPPADGGAWDAVEEAGLELPTGTVRVESVMGLPAGPDLPVGAPGRYRLRAHCRGRAAARALVGRRLHYTGVEIWLMQLWQP
ncbi:hypothetical protein AB0F81_33390, partial [Actinoplanes sp. NPDC024001]|uniref:hypothetical protein n=1 Tax=Actinoplanes sp. NPDC024001 TaxID=3154598 RepID=UPI0033F9ABA5